MFNPRDRDFFSWDGISRQKATSGKSSAIFQHIQKCDHYADSLKEQFSDQPSDSELRKHLFSHFKILTKNRYSTHSRKLSEGLFITISEPELNRQVFHRK